MGSDFNLHALSVSFELTSSSILPLLNTVSWTLAAADTSTGSDVGALTNVTIKFTANQGSSWACLATGTQMSGSRAYVVWLDGSGSLRSGTYDMGSYAASSITAVTAPGQVGHGQVPPPPKSFFFLTLPL